MKNFSVRTHAATMLYKLEQSVVPTYERAKQAAEIHNTQTARTALIEYLLLTAQIEMLQETIDFDARYPGILNKDFLHLMEV